jgi:two-component sensor histidine kinase
MNGDLGADEIPPATYAKAVLNILDDFTVERRAQETSHKAMVNILDDFGAERQRLVSTQKAILNIAEDGEAERGRLRETQRAVLNILDDLGAEKVLLEKTQGEVVRSEKAMRGSLREKEVLLKEIHHRVKNNLQVISSLLNLQARYLPDPAAREIFRASQHRVQSIALVHEKLYQSADLSHVDFSDYTVALLDNLFETFDAGPRGISKLIDIGAIRLSVDIAIPCGLIVNELVTNALKHAFPGGREGTVRVILREGADGALDLTVGDDGVGLPEGVDPRKTSSLGLDLVFTFADQLDAQVEVGRQGGSFYRFRFRKVDP